MRFPPPICSRTGKHAYMTEESAREHLTKIQERWWTTPDSKGHGRPPERVFQCEFCHFWHFTHQKQRNVV